MENKEMLLNICFTICVCLAQLRMLVSVQKIFKKKKKTIVNLLISLLFGILFAGCIIFVKNLPACYVFIFLCVTILYAGYFHLNLFQSYIFGSYYVFHMIVLKGIVVGCISIFFKRNSFIILSNPDLAIVSEIIVQLLLLFVFILYRRILKVGELRNFLVCKKQLVLVLSCHLTLVLFLLFNSFSFYYNLDLVWISISQILVGVLLYAIYMIVLTYGIYVSDLLQHKIRDKNQIETIKQQMTQQNSLLKIEKVLNQFKHDYREQILSVEYFIENNQKVQALEELKKDYIKILNVLPSTKKYSNNLIVNSLFIDRQSACDEAEIKMDASIYMPLDLAMTEKQCHEVFRVLLENAMDANEKVAYGKRYILVKSEVEQQWLSILFENPFKGNIIFENQRPVPHVSDLDREGLGLLFVEEVLSEAEGFIRYEVDEERKIFKAMVLIPIETV